MDKEEKVPGNWGRLSEKPMMKELEYANEWPGAKDDLLKKLRGLEENTKAATIRYNVAAFTILFKLPTSRRM